MDVKGVRGRVQGIMNGGEEGGGKGQWMRRGQGVIGMARNIRNISRGKGKGSVRSVEGEGRGSVERVCKKKQKDEIILV